MGCETFDRMNHLQFQSPVGAIALTWNSQSLLTRLDWYYTGMSSSDVPVADWCLLSRVGIPPVVLKLLDELKGYLHSGDPLQSVPWESIDTRQWSDFQNRVYRAISLIPHGETRTYAWVARRAGQIGATRAVGQALKKNPLPILIPCHRVVSESDLGGFMGSNDPNQPELQLKRRLIELENTYLNPVFPFLAAM